MCNPPNGFFAAPPSHGGAARFYSICIALPMTVPPTLIIDITLTKYLLVVNNRYANSPTILEKFHVFCPVKRSKFSVSAPCCQLSWRGGFLQKKTAADPPAGRSVAAGKERLIRCRGSWGWRQSPLPDPRRWGYSRPCRRRCTCRRPPCRNSRCRSGRTRWSFPRRSRGT